MHIRTDSVHSSIGSRALGVHTSTLDVDKVGNEAELQGDFAGLSSRLKVSGIWVVLSFSSLLLV